MSSPVERLYEALPRARALAESGKLDEARRLLESLAPTAEGSSMFQHARGVLAMHAQDLLGAVTAFRQAVALEPEIAEHRAALGSALLDLARGAADDERGRALDAALVELEAAWRLGHRAPDAGTSYGFALELVGRAEEGLAVLEGVLARHPGHVPAWFNKASALKALGRTGEARAALDEVLRLAPGFPPAVAALARV
jgi:tetratricopeptide (TPR) repeat protein